MSENHARFLAHLESSEEAVGTVAAWLTGVGIPVQRPSVQRADRHGNWKRYADHGDLFIPERLEVKRLGVDFSSAVDWPYGEKYIVCAKHAWDRADPKPAYFIILSQSLRAVSLVSGDSREVWYEEARTDRRYEGDEATQAYYLCPLSRVQFLPMVPGEPNLALVRALGKIAIQRTTVPGSDVQARQVTVPSLATDEQSARYLAKLEARVYENGICIKGYP